MILFGTPRAVQDFFRPVRGELSRPLRRALPVLVLALLLAPHSRSLKTLGAATLDHRVHASTISRRLRNGRWRTHDWSSCLFDDLLDRADRFERRSSGPESPPQAEPKPKRQWHVAIDATYKTTTSAEMENLITINSRRRQGRRKTRCHAFVMGMLITEAGARLPLPRKSYYTKAYCAKAGKRYRTQVELAADLLSELRLPDDVELTVTFDSALDAKAVHRVCRRRNFRAVFPLDPNRSLSSGAGLDDPALAGRKVVAWTRSWSREEFSPLELQHANEEHPFVRRRHPDNLRLRKTQRRYLVAARDANVSHLGACLIVASYKENPGVELTAGQAADWWAYHEAPVVKRKGHRPQPARWHGKVLACTDRAASARQVIEWYELRWQIELLFREIKSRLQFGRYVLFKFEAVERYLDLLLMGFLLLERERLRELERRRGASPERGGGQAARARTTDRLRSLEGLCQQWNADVLERLIRTERGRQRLLRDLRKQVPCHVA